MKILSLQHLVLLMAILIYAVVFLFYLAAKIQIFRECSKQKSRNLNFNAANFDFAVNFDPITKEILG